MKEKYKEYRGFWYKEDEELWRISREEDDSHCDVWYFAKESYSLDSAINRVIQMDDFNNICDNIIAEFGPSGFTEFIKFAEHRYPMLRRDNEKIINNMNWTEKQHGNIKLVDCKLSPSTELIIKAIEKAQKDYKEFPDLRELMKDVDVG